MGKYFKGNLLYLVIIKKEGFIINKIHIWVRESNILRMKKANHFFKDGTYFRANLYLQTIIIMYINIITGYKIPGI